MGYYLVMGPCVACGRVFSFHPHRVPSIRRTPQSPREPVCRACVERANVLRKAKGLDPLEILPGAYEPAEEGLES